jgi:hypothetical protein
VAAPLPPTGTCRLTMALALTGQRAWVRLRHTSAAVLAIRSCRRVLGGRWPLVIGQWRPLLRARIAGLSVASLGLAAPGRAASRCSPIPSESPPATAVDGVRRRARWWASVGPEVAATTGF